MSDHVVNPFSFNKKIGRSEHLLTLPLPLPPPHPFPNSFLHPIISHFYLTPISCLPQNGCHMCITPIYVIGMGGEISIFCRNKMSGIPVKNHRKKPRGFLKESETNSCEITRN